MEYPPTGVKLVLAARGRYWTIASENPAINPRIALCETASFCRRVADASRPRDYHSETKPTEAGRTGRGLECACTLSWEC